MDIAIMSSSLASALSIGIAVAGCLVVTVIMVLSDDQRKPALALFTRNLGIFMVPLLLLFGYIVVIWGARIFTR